LTLTDGSFLDIWLSTDGDYAYHQITTTFGFRARNPDKISRHFQGGSTS
jgi:hypothetical protein